MKLPLLIFSLTSRLASGIKGLFYTWGWLKPQKAPFPVISIGNITLGGSEKTPLVMELLSFLLELGWKPALVTRGYKSAWERRGGILADGQCLLATWKEGGDEPFMVASRLPRAGVFVGKKRLRSCHAAKELGFDISVLDDGFQHRKLHRDLDIVLHNPEERIALRESPGSLRRADVILIKDGRNHGAEVPSPRPFPRAKVFGYSVFPKEYICLSTRESFSQDFFKGKKVVAFCAIARPERFSSLLESLGVEIAAFLKFPDHHRYPPASLAAIEASFRKLEPEAAVTTEKDAVKIMDHKDFLKNIRLHTLRIGLRIPPGFHSLVRNFLENIPRP